MTFGFHANLSPNCQSGDRCYPSNVGHPVNVILVNLA